MKTLELLKRVLIICVLLFGVQSLSAQTNEMPQATNDNDLALSGYGYYGYGTISGAGKIYMEIEFCDGAICGRYYYVKTNKNRKNKAWIGLFGSWSNPSMILDEDGNGRKNGYFSGHFDGTGRYYGTFYRNDGKRFSFDIYLESNV